MSSTSSNPSASDVAWDEADTLISILRLWGIDYLVGTNRPLHPSDVARDLHSAAMLVRRLAQCDYPRVRDASISLFLLHPELSHAIIETLQNSEPKVAEQVVVETLATLYLQRLWSIRLTLALGRVPCFPEQPFAFLWQSRHLPSPAYHDGKWGLVALQEYEQKRSGLPLNFLQDWQNQVDHLLHQEEAKHQQTVDVLSILTDDTLPSEYEEARMSMRPSADKASIESFLTRLGQTFHKPGRLYMVGGAALVHLGIRPGFTQDIDIQVGGPNEGDLIVAIQRLILQLQINIKFASPGDFIPLPTQWETNAHYVGRYGTIDVFYFDFYSIALSKIERGSNRDIADVKLLIQKEIITLNELDAAYQEVYAQLGQGRYPQIIPERFAEHYIAIRQLL
ncbi:MAG: hypothetical protein JOZ71_09555 [Ktedonobacteraceae bacterium]|nr:hypothetical protein [Ktedonobacteraceae bacterium]